MLSSFLIAACLFTSGLSDKVIRRNLYDNSGVDPSGQSYGSGGYDNVQQNGNGQYSGGSGGYGVQNNGQIPNGYDSNGYDSNGYDSSGYDSSGYDSGSQNNYGSGSQNGYSSGSQNGYSSGSQNGYGSGSQNGYGYGSGSQNGYGSGSVPDQGGYAQNGQNQNQYSNNGDNSQDQYYQGNSGQSNNDVSGSGGYENSGQYQDSSNIGDANGYDQSSGGFKNNGDSVGYSTTGQETDVQGQGPVQNDDSQNSISFLGFSAVGTDEAGPTKSAAPKSDAPKSKPATMKETADSKPTSAPKSADATKKAASITKASSSPTPPAKPKGSTPYDCANQVLYIWNIYSQVIIGSFQKQSYIFDQYEGNLTQSGLSLDLLKDILKVLHPDRSEQQNKLIESLQKAQMEPTPLQKLIYNSTYGFPDCFNANNIIYKGVNSFRGAFELMASELPDLTSSVATNRINWLGDLKNFVAEINLGRFYNLQIKAGDSFDKFDDYGININSTMRYIKFDYTQSKYKTIQDSIKQFRTDTKKNVTIDDIQDVQIAYEVFDRINDLTSSGATDR